MNLFEPPTPPEAQPWTLSRLGWSLSRGVLLGAGLAALLFAWAWAPELIEGGEFNWFSTFAFIAVVEAAVWTWAWDEKPRTPIERLIAVIVGLAAGGYVLYVLAGLELAPWARANAEFVTLVAVCGVVGLLALRGGYRLWASHRHRVSLWFAAAAALWLSSEWFVKLGVVTDRWNDPRADIALVCVIVTGVLALVGLLAIMDWHIRRRERADTKEGARLPNETV